VAEAKGLAFTLELAGDVPETMQTDSKRLQQIVKNLPSNAFKFTEKGGVRLGISVAREGWSEDHETLNEAGGCSRSRWRTAASASRRTSRW